MKVGTLGCIIASISKFKVQNEISPFVLKAMEFSMNNNHPPPHPPPLSLSLYRKQTSTYFYTARYSGVIARQSAVELRILRFFLGSFSPPYNFRDADARFLALVETTLTASSSFPLSIPYFCWARVTLSFFFLSELYAHG